MKALLATLACLLFLPGIAAARCGGTDMIAALPASEREALERAAQAAPYPEGLLWRAERGSTRLTIFGTYHFEHDRTRAHLDALATHIKAADAVYLEMSTADQERLERQMAEDPSIMFITEGPTLPDLLGEEDWRTLRDELGERGFPSFMAAKFKPIWASMMLGIGPCEAQAGALMGAGIDEMIGQTAAAAGVPTRSLEDATAVLSLLDDMPREEQLDAIRLFLAWPGDADDAAYTLRQRYLAQQTALIWEFSRKISTEESGPQAEANFERFETLLLRDRNAEWADLLTGDDVTGDVFIAAGAGHLPGEHGLLHMLETRGFKIERIPFDS
ncbi:TraB/GumN family protein [Roseovarius spongiae]|uniref:TraB/GumN family protein n=1 Tax=Roseovarius spongiae TaxID=2320272 RepID=UPI001FE6EEC3|nr:TraB/GumN family protein [Roseovarius spongiae]